MKEPNMLHLKSLSKDNVFKIYLLENTMANVSEVIATLPDSFNGAVGWAIIGVKIFIGLIGLYFLFWLVSLFLNYRKNRMIKEVLKNVKEINNKLGKKKAKDQTD